MTITQSTAAEACCLDDDLVHNLGVGVEGAEVASSRFFSLGRVVEDPRGEVFDEGAEPPPGAAAAGPRVVQALAGADGWAMGSL